MFEIPGKHIQGLFDRDHDEDDDDHSDNKVYSKSLESRHSSDHSLETQPIGIVFNNDHVQEAPKMPPKPPTGKWSDNLKFKRDA
ncbi:RopGEF9, partial [Trifolium medium]|nr:RopGEF9 [Trifolium medium]